MDHQREIPFFNPNNPQDPFWGLPPQPSAPYFEHSPSLSEQTRELLIEIRNTAETILHPVKREPEPESEPSSGSWWPSNFFSGNTINIFNEQPSALSSFFSIFSKKPDTNIHIYEGSRDSRTHERKREVSRKESTRKKDESSDEEIEGDQGSSTGSKLFGVGALIYAAYNLFQLGKTDGEFEVNEHTLKLCKNFQVRYLQESDYLYQNQVIAVVGKANTIFKECTKQLQHKRYILITLICGGILTFLGGTGLTHFIADRSKTLKCGVIVLLAGGGWKLYNWGNSTVIETQRKRMAQQLINGIDKLLPPENSEQDQYNQTNYSPTTYQPYPTATSPQHYPPPSYAQPGYGQQGRYNNQSGYGQSYDPYRQ